MLKNNKSNKLNNFNAYIKLKYIALVSFYIYFFEFRIKYKIFDFLVTKYSLMNIFLLSNVENFLLKQIVSYLIYFLIQYGQTFDQVQRMENLFLMEFQ